MPVIAGVRRGCVISLLTFLLSVVVVRSASAQRVALSVQPEGATPQTLLHNVGTGETEAALPGSLAAAVFTADGRYALWTRINGPASGLELYDVVSRTGVRLPYSFRPAVAHPRELAVYGWIPRPTLNPGTQPYLARLDVGGLRQLEFCGSDVARSFDLSGDGLTLVVVCWNGSSATEGTTRIVTVDTAREQPVRTIPFAEAGPQWVASNHDGSRVLFSTETASSTDVSVADTITGAVTRVFREENVSSPQLSWRCSPVGRAPAADTVAVSCRQFYSVMRGGTRRNEIIHLDTLERQPLTSVPRTSFVGVAPGRQTAVVDLPRLGVLLEDVPDAVGIVDIATDRLTTRVALPATVAAVAYAPAAPRNVSSSVNGRNVILGWTAPQGPAAAGYVIEAGSAPGQRDLAVLPLGVETSVTVFNVPSGSYFVRVRAVNHTGTGGASEELTIVVP